MTVLGKMQQVLDLEVAEELQRVAAVVGLVGLAVALLNQSASDEG